MYIYNYYQIHLMFSKLILFIHNYYYNKIQFHLKMYLLNYLNISIMNLLIYHLMYYICLNNDIFYYIHNNLYFLILYQFLFQ